MTDKVPDDDDNELSDLLTGGEEIARYLKWTKSKLFHAIRKGTIPFGRIGAVSIIASKKALKEHFEKLSRGIPA